MSSLQEAAPDLLEACKQMIGVCDELYERRPVDLFAVHDILEAAINQAEGRT